MGQVALEGMEFFAFHGYFDEEQKIGNKYSIDLYVETDLHDAASSDNLDETVNYVVLYRIVADEMKIQARLLEHVGHRILDGVMQAFPQVKSVKVAVSKYNPPFGGICHRSKVTLKRKRAKVQP
ncbi:dihydroneopterin aldolase [Hymenobacter lucidus]|uniref:7,8-dihydroneopterin aldolase n=1 Tax=Hymenobacter lucidus TaxID=2880930 RepID=A0ABS8AQZ1_9BACT|nr:dihydroneopterin aldolase [Hymenobacter lucidus]MCB2407432.1 dihydroneopterin aldolase [Hymenobacter lucidus]